jgi:hypothetical protein
VTKHIETDQNKLAIPKTKQISPEDPRPIPTAARKQWDSAAVLYQCKVAAGSTRALAELQSTR